MLFRSICKVEANGERSVASSHAAIDDHPAQPKWHSHGRLPRLHLAWTEEQIDVFVERHQGQAGGDADAGHQQAYQNDSLATSRSQGLPPSLR